MKMTRIMAIIMAVAALLLIAGCAPKAEAKEIPQWSLKVEGVDGTAEFTSKDAVQLKQQEMETAVKNKKGEEIKDTYTGVLLKDVLTAMGVTELSSLTIEAADGYSAEYDSDTAYADNVIVGWLKNGEPMENGQINILPSEGFGNLVVKQAAKLIINK